MKRKISIGIGGIFAILAIFGLGLAGCGGETGGGNENSPVEITSAKGIELRLIPAGTFTMGSPETEAGRYTNETQHQVTLSKSFYMGKYQVTQEQYLAVVQRNPSDFTTAVGGESGTPGKLPVERVTWYDVVEFCNKLSVLEGLQEVYTISERTPATGYPITSATVTVDWSKNGYRLPTEAEWEYACRAGTTTAWHTGNTEAGPPHLNTAAWYSNNAGSKTHQVGLKTPNTWGLYDMHGNVDEWCWDWYGDYVDGAQTDPVGALSGTDRVARGGAWAHWAALSRSACRDYLTPSYQTSRGHGFRLVRH
jgi:formylglycine-generating enzyme required for sulfatase activity